MIDAVLLIAFGGPTAPAEIRPFLELGTRGRRIPDRAAGGGRPPLRADAGRRSPLRELTRPRPTGSTGPAARGGTCPSSSECATGTRSARDAGGMGARGHRRSSDHPVVVPQPKPRGSAILPTSPPPASAAGAPRWSSRRRGSSTPLSWRRWRTASRGAGRGTADERADTPVVFTATACRPRWPTPRRTWPTSRHCPRVAARLGHARWSLAYQSRRGSPRDPWLETDWAT